MNRWQICIEKLEQEIPLEQFKAWIKPLIFLEFEEEKSTLKIGVSTHIKLNHVKNNFLNRIESIAREVIKPDICIKLEVHKNNSVASKKDPPETFPRKNHPKPPSPSSAKNPFDLRTSENSKNENQPTESISCPDPFSKLRAELTFDTFIQGKANQMAWAAALQVVDRPGTVYNPLFLYGGVGLGKTHLAHAVGNSLTDRRKTARIRYIHAQDYFDEMVRGIQTKSIQAFKKKYQTLDLLLIDDIQFLGGKERTQEEFFYIFESLLSSRKQLIITCDTYPKDLSAFEDRLVSRFGSGLIVEIEPPELEMRVAILLKKSEQAGENLPEEIAFFIAKNLRSNVRELEGALLRVLAFTRFRKTEITLDLAKQALTDILQINRPAISIETIQKTVADFFKIKGSDMNSRERTADIAQSRQIAMYFSKELTQKSFPEIGKNFGGRDHSTVMHAVKKIAGLRQHDQEFNRQLHVLEQMLRS